MIDILMEYFSYPFVRYALIVGILIALCASLVGVPLVLKRYSFIGDGLSHVAFGAMAIATVCDVTDNLYIVMPVTVLAAVLLLQLGQNARLKGDAAIALISVAALAVGYFLMNVFSVSANVSGDVCSTLFGSTSILTLTQSEVTLCAVVSLVVLGVCFIWYHKIFAITFDEDFARATGTSVSGYNFLVAVITAVIIVVAMKLVGTLLISALIIFPALTAMRLFKSFKSVLVASALFAVVCAGVGIVASILYSTPTGATIVICNLILFVLSYFISLCKYKNCG